MPNVSVCVGYVCKISEHWTLSFCLYLSIYLSRYLSTNYLSVFIHLSPILSLFYFRLYILLNCLVFTGRERQIERYRERERDRERESEREIDRAYVTPNPREVETCLQIIFYTCKKLICCNAMLDTFSASLHLHISLHLI